VRWQGLTLVSVGIVVGIPLGIVGGRFAWRYFADRLGVPPRFSVPVSWIALEVVLTLVLGFAAVSLPARAAARLHPADELLAP
jgi:ABC-type antimicrobial peptide transport system permease subunit